MAELAGNFNEAARLYLLAAQQGDATAQGSLGRLYRAGLGVPQDYVQAYKWVRAAADQDDPLGEAIVAILNMLGEGRAVDMHEAVVWARRAAEQDCALKFRLVDYCASAQSLLGGAYLDGLGVPQDYVLAHMWANLASASLRAATLRKNATDIRDAAARKMTPDQIAEAQRLAREWKPRAGK